MVLRFLRRLLGRPNPKAVPAGEQRPMAVAAPRDVPRGPDSAHGPTEVGGIRMPASPPPPLPPPPAQVVAAASPPPPPPPPPAVPPPPPPPDPPVALRPPPPPPAVQLGPAAEPGDDDPEDAAASTGAQRKARIRLLLSDGTVTEPTGDSHLLDRLAYLADNLLPDGEGRSQSE